MVSGPRINSPRHSDLATTLENEIVAARYAVGSKFPSEEELQHRFSVGRHTIREALNTLTERGLLVRRRRIGTFVASAQPRSKYVHNLHDLTDLLDYNGQTELSIRHSGFIRRLDLPTFGQRQTKDRWLRLAGVRFKKEGMVPLCWTEIFIPERFAPQRAAIPKVEKVWDFVRLTNSLKLDYVEQNIAAATLPDAIAEILDTPPGTAGLLVDRRYVAHGNVEFEISRNLYPAGRASLRGVIHHHN